MITLKEACEIVKKKHPRFQLLQCLDFGDAYYFNTYPMRFGHKEPRLAILAAKTGIQTFIYKANGKECMVGSAEGFYEFFDKNKSKNVKEVDISQYLSLNDVEFAKKANIAMNDPEFEKKAAEDEEKLWNEMNE